MWPRAVLILQEISRGSVRKEFSTLSDAGQTLPSSSGGSDVDASTSKASAGPQSLSPGREGRSSSIGEVRRALFLHASITAAGLSTHADCSLLHDISLQVCTPAETLHAQARVGAF